MRFSRVVMLLVLVFFVCSSAVLADVTFRVMTYNGLKLDTADSDRQTYFQTVLNHVNPDVLLMQEMVDAGGADLILNALGPGYARATFNDGPDTDHMFFYRTSTVSFVSQAQIPTELRNISEYVATINGNEVRFYSCHLKASTGSANEAQRDREVTELRNHLASLPAGTEWVIVGDMNIYDAGEPAYQRFIATGNGRSEDLIPANMVGNWHDNAAFASIHTQSPRTTQFGGGATGGIDDRFDMIFANYGVNDGAGIDYISGSYTVVGNDGNHFNLAVNDGNNSSVPANVADALHYASDHLPVYADFVSIGGASNTPPVANANGAYTGTISQTISFSSAGSSDADGSIVSYLWDFGDGATSTTMNPVYSYSSTGTYTVTLTVTDNLGATGTDQTTATITSGGSGSTGVIFSEILYDTPGTDSDEEWIELYNGGSSTIDLGGWTIIDNNGTGTSYTFSAGTTIAPNSYLTVAAVQTGFFAMYGYDADVYGSIPALNNGGDALILQNEAAQPVDAVAWEGGASAGVPSGWGSTTQPVCATGETIFRMDVNADTDTYADWSVATGNGNPQTQATTPGNVAPIAHANGTYSGLTGQAISFSSAGSSDSDGSIVSYLWDFGDGTTSSAANPSHTYQTAGTYAIHLTVTDDDSATGMDQTTATIENPNAAPTANANGTYSGLTGQAISFSSAGSSDSDGSIVSYLWDFGDGTTSTVANPSHTYQTAGTYAIHLTVTDDDGATGMDQTTATISDPVVASVVFSEIFYDTPGTESIEEWIELYNPTGSTVDLSGWTITDNNGAGSTYTIPPGTHLDSASFLTIAADPAGFTALYGADADLYGSIPALNNSGEALILQNGSAMVDAVAWEGGAGAGLPSGWGSTSLPNAPQGSSIVRTDPNTDTDTYIDWSVLSGNGDPHTLAPASVELLYADFESGWDGWSDGGGDCARYSGSRSYGGSYSIRLRDNSGTASAMTSGYVDVSAYDQLDIEFAFYAYSMENNEDFWVRYYDGSAWQTVASYARGTDFNNNTFYTATVTIDAGSYVFPSNAQFRFQCDASGNADHIYIDEVRIIASTVAGAASMAGRSSHAEIMTNPELVPTNEPAVPGSVVLSQNYPNPFNPATAIDFDLATAGHVSLQIYDLQGRLVTTLVDEFRPAGAYTIRWNGTDARGQAVNSGVYLYVMTSQKETQTRMMTLVK
ncbi:MAG: PKD domain-containing protein [Gemmatimonadetes bacterium]|nr:MAG: PKD domain-containing protein [Gemmatimonadota bacterium]